MSVTTKQTQTGTVLRLVAQPRRRKVSGDRFRTPEAQEMFRARWNAARERLAR